MSEDKTYRITVETEVTLGGPRSNPKADANELGRDHLNQIKWLWGFTPNGKPTQGITYRVEEVE